MVKKVPGLLSFVITSSIEKKPDEESSSGIICRMYRYRHPSCRDQSRTLRYSKEKKPPTGIAGAAGSGHSGGNYQPRKTSACPCPHRNSRAFGWRKQESESCIGTISPHGNRCRPGANDRQDTSATGGYNQQPTGRQPTGTLYHREAVGRFRAPHRYHGNR